MTSTGPSSRDSSPLHILRDDTPSRDEMIHERPGEAVRSGLQSAETTVTARRLAIATASPAAVGLPALTTPAAELQAIIDEHERAGGKTHHFRPSRLVLINCWVFGYQEFPFVDGHLVLSGNNGSGKTTVLTGAIPVALFGTTAVGALDTMEGRARTIEYLVLGSADDHRDKHYIETGRTAHVLWEFHQPSSGKYVTVGQVLTGSRTASGGRGSIEKRGVVIRDGQRVGKTIRLWDFDDNGMLRPWDASDVAGRLVDPNAPVDMRNGVTDSAEEFRRIVAREIFGTDNLREVAAYERTLRVMRRPMLNNKELRPSEVADMLRNSLPELEGGIIDQLESSLNGLDRIRVQLANLETELAATTELQAAHASLITARATEFAQNLSFQDQQVRTLLTNIDNKTAERTGYENSRQVLLDKVTAGAATLESIEKTLRLLRAEKGASIDEAHRLAVASVLKAKGEIEAITLRRARALRAIESAVLAEATATGDTQRAMRVLETLAKDLRASADEQRWSIGREAARILVERCAPRSDATLPSIVPTETPVALMADARTRHEAIRVLREAAAAFDAAEKDYQIALAQLKPHEDGLETATTRKAEAGTALDLGRTDAGDAITLWGAAHRTAIPTSLDVDRVSRAVRRFDGTEKEARLLTVPVLQEVRNEHTRRHEHVLQVEQERRDGTLELTAKQAELATEQSRKDLEPDVTAEQEVVREALAEANVEAIPLYAAVEVQSDAPQVTLALIEQILTDAALLNTLVIAPEDRVRARGVLGCAAGVGGADRWIAPALGDGSTSVDATMRSLLCPSEASSIAPRTVPSVLARLRCAPESNWASAREQPDTLWMDVATGAWRYGMSEGRSATDRDGPQYIGHANRAAERARRIRVIEAECASLVEVIERHRVHLVTLTAERTATHNALDAFDQLPDVSRLPTLVSNLRTRQHEEAEALQRFTNAQTGVQKVIRVRQAHEEARAAASVPLPEFGESSVADIAGAMTAAKQWIQQADRWPSTWDVVTGAHRRIDVAQEAREEARANHETEGTALETAEATLISREADVEEYARQLQSDEVRSVKKRISDLGRRYDEVKDQHIRDARDEAKIEPNIDGCNGMIREYRERLVAPQSQRNSFLQAFVGYIRAHADAFGKSVQDLVPMPDLAVVALADAVRVAGAEEAYRAAYRRFSGTTNVSHDQITAAQGIREGAHNVFTGVYHTRRVHLETYAIEWMMGTDVVSSIVASNQLTSLIALETHLRQHVMQQRAAIRAQEDDLYRRIFLEKLSDGLRHQIRDTRITVKQLNEVLSQRPLHDAEVLSVKWRPLTISRRRGRDREGDLWSTEEEVARRAAVVDILTTRDLQNASDEAHDLVYAYFRDRLNFLREHYGRPGEKPGFTRLDGHDVRSFRDVLAMAFDYRQWYEFGIMSNMPESEHPQEITDDRFPTRSGGQRVSATMVPLLAALEVRCRAFGPTSPAPRLIALDEAFAGVDEEHTEALFETLEAFDMSWLMTSDKLTGASPALTGAMTAVLSKRTQSNSPSVVAVNYLVWDGTFEFDSDTAPFRMAMIAQREGDTAESTGTA